jgi:hypothetical protein
VHLEKGTRQQAHANPAPILHCQLRSGEPSGHCCDSQQRPHLRWPAAVAMLRASPAERAMQGFTPISAEARGHHFSSRQSLGLQSSAALIKPQPCTCLKQAVYETDRGQLYRGQHRLVAHLGPICQEARRAAVARRSHQVPKCSCTRTKSHCQPLRAGRMPLPPPVTLLHPPPAACFMREAGMQVRARAHLQHLEALQTTSAAVQTRAVLRLMQTCHSARPGHPVVYTQ